MNRRFTIGFLDEDAHDEYHNLIAKGMYMSALKHDIDIIRFGHFSVSVTTHDHYQEMVMIEFVKQFKLDGLIFLGWARAAANPAFGQILGNLPMVSLGSSHEGIPGVIFSGDKYIGEILEHLIKVHNYKRIAYIAPANPDSRADTYRSVMMAYNIFDPVLYVDEKVLENLSISARGKRAVEILLDERKAEIDAIVSLYNDETYEIIKTLKSRGVRIPEDIAVTSYEDGEVSRFSTPAITTVWFPWRELGYYACEAMHTLLTKGRIPMQTEIPGRIIIRSSCGCIPIPDLSPDSSVVRPARVRFEELGANELDALSKSLSDGTAFSAGELRNLLEKFRLAFREGCAETFLGEFVLQLRKIEFYSDYEEFEQVVINFRNALLPYFLSYSDKNEKAEKVAWAESLFFSMQAILRSKISNAWFRENMLYNNLKLVLKDIGQILVTRFGIKDLFDTLEAGLSEIGAKGCYLYLFRNPGDPDLFRDYRLEFEFGGGNGVPDVHSGERPEQRSFADVLFRENRSHFILAHLLHVGNYFLGFVLFDTTLMDIRIYRILSLQLSAALNGIILFERLEEGYRKLMEQAHKKGMADTTGVLHNIANIMGNIGTAAQSLENLLAGSPVNDLKMANTMLAEKLDEMADFLKSGQKGKMLMQYYVSLGDAFEVFRSRLQNYISKMGDRIRLVEEIIDAQQDYTGVKSSLERIDIVPVVDDALGVCRFSIERSGISVVRKHSRSVKVLAHRTKLFHVLVNIIKNAVESMENYAGERILTISMSREAGSVCVRVGDTGPGISEENLKSIFAYGFTTKKSGHGFGLHSCANYMTEMQGKIWAENVQNGHGAVFVLQFRTPTA